MRKRKNQHEYMLTQEAKPPSTAKLTGGGLSRQRSTVFLMGGEVSRSAPHTTKNTTRLSFSRTDTIAIFSNPANDPLRHKAQAVKTRVARGSLVCMCSDL